MLQAIKRLAKRIYRWRSAITGRYVTERYAKEHPRETVKERA